MTFEDSLEVKNKISNMMDTKRTKHVNFSLYWKKSTREALLDPSSKDTRPKSFSLVSIYDRELEQP